MPNCIGIRLLLLSIASMKRLELSSVWALLAAFEDPLPIPGNVEGAFVKKSDSVSWIANNTKKLLNSENGPHCWSIFSTASFGKRNKVPQVGHYVVKYFIKPLKIVE